MPIHNEIDKELEEAIDIIKKDFYENTTISFASWNYKKMIKNRKETIDFANKIKEHNKKRKE